MPLDPVTPPIIIAIGRLLSVVLGLQSYWDKRSEHEEKTLIAMSKAFHCTLQYYACRESHPPNQEKEFAVAQVWEEASILMRKYDKDLAKRLGLKSTFWRNQEIWTGKDVQAAQIGLQLVKVQADTLLITKKNPKKRKKTG